MNDFGILVMKRLKEFDPPRNVVWLAKECGKSKDTIQKVLRRVEPDLNLAMKISVILDLKIDDMLVLSIFSRG